MIFFRPKKNKNKKNKNYPITDFTRIYFTHQASVEHVSALPFTRYQAVIINCSEEEIETTDVKTRKLLTMQGQFTHPEAVHEPRRKAEE